MRIDFRQGIVSHQPGGFLKKNSLGHIDIIATNRPVTVTIAHRYTNYIHVENYNVSNAWVGPFSPAVNYWLYWDFDPLTFTRSFGHTVYEPVAQSAVPGAGNADVDSIIPGSNGNGAFVVDEFYALYAGRELAVVGSTTGLNGTYTVTTYSYNPLSGQTTIFVEETVANVAASGALTLDIDAYGEPLLVEGRHWYDTTNHKHYVRTATSWREVIRVFAAQLINSVTFLPQSINHNLFTGTQIGDTSSVRAGRVLFDEASDPLRRDDRTFFTSEDQFFASAARIDALRLESNVARGQAAYENAIAAFKVVAWKADGKVQTAQYNDVGTTVVGVLTEDLLLNEVGAIIVQGVITNPEWNWTSGPGAVPVGTPLWVDNGALVPYDPHVFSNRTDAPITDVLAGSDGTQYFEVGGGYTLSPGQVFTVINNSTNNDGVYTVTSTEYNTETIRTKIFVNEIIIEATVEGSALFALTNFPAGRVPVARVLSNDTVIFEQGLGGKGDKGDTGSVEDLPPATIIDVGGVTLTTPCADPDSAVAVSECDPRLTDPRPPLPHTHLAVEIIYTPAGGITSTNVQAALVELGLGKVNRSGDTMTGFLTLHSDPTSPMHAVTKQYVDALVNGLVWLKPIQVVNMISDIVTVPPVSPELGDSYIIPAGATGAWSTIDAGNVVTWNGLSWDDRGPLSDLAGGNDIRVGISVQSITTASGSFTGYDNDIAVYDSSGTLLDISEWDIPTHNNAVYVSSESDLFAYNQFAFSGTEWILFGGTLPLVPDNVTIVQTGSVLSVKQFDDGGINDVKYWQGLEPSDLDLIYAPITHTHNATDVTVTPYTGTNWGTPIYSEITNISAVTLQLALQELQDEKQAKRPAYSTAANLPAAANVQGMTAYVADEGALKFSDGVIWQTVTDGDHTHDIPYDITFFAGGPSASIPTLTIGMFVAPRTIAIAGGSDHLVGYCKVAPLIPTTFTLILNEDTINPVGYITFLAGQHTTDSTVACPLNVTMVAGDVLELVAPLVAENTISDVSISITACATTGACPT